MRTRSASLLAASVVATAMVTFLIPGNAQAHPMLGGTWTMGNNYDILEVAPGQQIANGVWEGKYLNFRNGGTNYGTYVLRLNNLNEGTCTFQWAGGQEMHYVNLQQGRMVYGTAIYIRNW